MNNNFEAIKSLVSLLVKKAGFDINSNYSEEELAKTKESIKKLQSEKEGSNNQKTLSKIIDALKLRQANWENNAEIVGKSLLNAYKEGKEYTSVKARIELLGNLASKGTENLSAGNLYTRLNELESKYNELNDKINTYEYKNTEEREMDEKYKAYLDNKIDSLNAELKTVNKELIGEFVSKKADNTLETYIRDENKAWTEDIDGETRVYLVKDKSGNIALFFSLKCGLLVGENLEEKLSDEYQEFVETVIDVKRAKNENGIRNMYEAGMSLYGDEVDHLFEIAERRLDSKTQSIDIGQSENTINVPNCISAIELRHLCKNEKYVMPEEIDIPLGFGVFWEIIVPHILKISELVGCKYVYLFAADNSEVPKTDVQMENTIKYSKDYDMGLEEDILDEETSSEEDVKKLVSYYINNLKFRPVSKYTILKPHFERTCYTLIQDVEDLQHKRESIWYSHDQDNEMGLNAE